MEVRFGYKHTEEGMIPEDWEVRPLGGIAPIATGNTPPTRDPANYGDEFLFVSPVDMGWTKHISRTEKMLSRRGFSISRPFPAGSILFVCIGSTIGKCGIAPETLTSNQQINAILPSAGTSSDYLYYAVSAVAAKVRSLAGEQAVPIVNKTQFSATTIPLPPTTAEQEAIAEALSDADALIESLEQLLLKKRQLKKGAMQELLTGKKRLPSFGGEWEVKPFDGVLVRLNARAHQIQTSDYQTTGQYPVVDQGKEHVIGFSDRHDKRFRCPEGGVIVFGDHTCIVKFIDFDFLVGADGTQVLQAKSGHCTRFHALQLQHTGVEATGYNRHFKFFKEREFLAPPLPEQTAIASALSDMDAEIVALEAKLVKARWLKQGMMQELLTGRIRLV